MQFSDKAVRASEEEVHLETTKKSNKQRSSENSHSKNDENISHQLSVNDDISVGLFKGNKSSLSDMKEANSESGNDFAFGSEQISIRNSYKTQ